MRITGVNTLERGESLRKIVESLGVGLSTVSDIYRSRRQLTLCRTWILRVANEVEHLLTVDNTPLCETLTDDEIFEVVEKDENEDDDVSYKPNEELSHSSFKFGLKWMEQQKKFSTTGLMLMRHIRDVTAQKLLSSFKQKLYY
ncbi:putative Trp operon transcriptional repressor [Trichinella spiralis]|uniref:putative Trp operon transcriptional repressor n=1 Tax=Trichinella spiralis TaxID=6334 RepID=UPI0001EFB2FA|nr:putative Trp operon transcriptional repressor [Trichinella spiralis]